jgi:predicted  nucleic acid-binding Zn-ribbon protein
MSRSASRIDYLEKMINQLIKDNQILQQKITSLEGRTDHLDIMSKKIVDAVNQSMDDISSLETKCDNIRIDLESGIENLEMQLDMK